MNNEERKLEILNNVLEAIDGDFISEDVLVEVVEALKEVISVGDSNLDRKIDELSDETKRGLSVIMSRLNSGDGKLADEIKSLKELISKVKTIKGDKGDKGDRGDPGKDGRDGIDGKDGDIKDLSPQEVRDSLELLLGEERLDLSAIRGVTVGKTAPTNPKENDIWFKTR